jgi:hypothetical protein
MTDIINLKRVRKQKRRTEAEAHAANNRVTHGRTKAEKKRSQTEASAAAKRLDGHKRERDD